MNLVRFPWFAVALLGGGVSACSGAGTSNDVGATGGTGSTLGSTDHAGAGGAADNGSEGGATANSSSSAGAAQVACNGEQAVCEGIPFGLCNEVQMAPGHCVDWSKVGASACQSPADCPASNRTAKLPSGAGSAVAICVKAASAQFSVTDFTSEPGYCAVYQTSTDPTGVAQCEPDTCGAGGYCSYIRNQYGATVIGCTWPG